MSISKLSKEVCRAINGSSGDMIEFIQMHQIAIDTQELKQLDQKVKTANSQDRDIFLQKSKLVREQLLQTAIEMGL